PPNYDNTNDTSKLQQHQQRLQIMTTLTLPPNYDKTMTTPTITVLLISPKS
ncbi:9435_t:CDS:1, partial [Gigaspora rosea]